MTISILEALARKWLASKHWGGWHIGMCYMFGADARRCVVANPAEVWGAEAAKTFVPDLTHPGTVAYLREDLKPAWPGRAINIDILPNGRCEIEISPYQSEDGTFAVLEYTSGYHDTEAEALMAALHAAPKAA